MKKIILFTTTMMAQLGAMAQWTQFPGQATDISCGSSTKFAVIASSAVHYYNFTSSAYVVLTGAASFNGLGYAADGTLIAKTATNWNSTSNLIRFNNNPPVYNAFTVITGVVDNHISVRANNFAIASVGTSTTTNNIYKWNGIAWSTLPGGSSVSAKKVVGGGGVNNDIYAMNWSATGNNVMAYTSTGVNQGVWAMISNSTLNVSDISVGDASKVLAIAGGQLYYRWNDAWVLDATAPANLIKVSAAADGTIMLLTSTNDIYRNTWANVNCGLSVASPVNTTAAQNLTVCAGQSTTLTATGNGSLDWNGSGVTGTGSTFVTPTVTSSTTFYVANTVSGCTSAHTPITVSVNVPAPMFTGTISSVCSGNTVTLTASGTQTISWYDSPNSTTAIATGTIYTTPSLTNATSYYISSTANGCETSRTVKTITINPEPPLPVDLSSTIGLQQNICAGNIAEFYLSNQCNWYTTSTGGTSFMFSNNYSTPTLNTTTTYYVDYTLNGCTSAPRVALVATVSAQPSVLSQTVQNLSCNNSADGSIVITTDNMPNSYTYTWLPNVSTTYSATGLSANIYTVQIANAGCVNTRTYSVTQPSAYNVPVGISGGTTLFYNDPYSGTPNFQWVDCNNNTPIAGAINSSFTPTVTGNYALTFGYGNCANTSTCNAITVATSVLEYQLLNAIALQPNPASTQFVLNDVLVGSNLSILDITGKVVYEKTLNEINETVETKDLSNGIYVIQLQNNGALTHKKLIISK